MREIDKEGGDMGRGERGGEGRCEGGEGARLKKQPILSLVSKPHDIQHV